MDTHEIDQQAPHQVMRIAELRAHLLRWWRACGPP